MLLLTHCADIKFLPSENAETLHEITDQKDCKYYQVSALTADYEWVEITVNEWTGWVPSKNLDIGKGGPVLDTPENSVRFDLINRNYL